MANTCQASQQTIQHSQLTQKITQNIQQTQWLKNHGGHDVEGKTRTHVDPEKRTKKDYNLPQEITKNPHQPEGTKYPQQKSEGCQAKRTQMHNTSKLLYERKSDIAWTD